MYQQADIQKLTAKLSRPEAEIAAIRRELAALPQQSAEQTVRETATVYIRERLPHEDKLVLLSSDKRLLRAANNENLFVLDPEIASFPEFQELASP